MKSQTKKLKEQIQPLQYIDERLNVLKNQYKGETAYIIAAGPSLNNFSVNQLKDKLKDKLVFCIKQSYHTYRDICDFHFVNFTNLSPYKWNDTSIVSWTYWFQQHPVTIQQNKWAADLLYPIFRNGNIPDKMSQSIMAKRDFENLMFDKTLERPWGPGIIFELAIPTAVHLGVKKIVTIGWDIGDINLWKNKNDENERHFVEHFYSDETHLYDKFTMDAEEIITVTESVPHLAKYLETRGIEFNIISDRNPVSQDVKRINLDSI